MGVNEDVWFIRMIAHPLSTNLIPNLHGIHAVATSRAQLRALTAGATATASFKSELAGTFHLRGRPGPAITSSHDMRFIVRD